ncbi:MAG: hypothetical protein KDE19_04595 [Caldilineaceae bacterium]|nr:hypothetical protein [Caldilineaceae bacterium]
MQTLIDFIETYILGPLNYVDRIEGLYKAALYQDSGHRFAIPRIDKGGKHTLRAVEEMLNSYGIAVYCRTYDAKHRYFRVKHRQANWAEYLLLHAGVELRGPLVNPRNAIYVARHPAGWMPQPWAAQEDDNEIDPPLAVTEDEAEDMEPNDRWLSMKRLIDW